MRSLPIALASLTISVISLAVALSGPASAGLAERCVYQSTPVSQYTAPDGHTYLDATRTSKFPSNTLWLAVTSNSCAPKTTNKSAREFKYPNSVNNSNVLK